jgi:hypothetical protein
MIGAFAVRETANQASQPEQGWMSMTNRTRNVFIDEDSLVVH